MKTAISIPDHLFRTGEALAKRLKVSRSELYARALGEYLAKHRADQITQRLNAVYDSVDGGLESGLGALQARSLGRYDW
jgi:metal-responsive CopG/Arc/MetJ family transcriptional regulator